MRLLHRAIAVALLAPLLALALSAYGFVGLRCRVTGMVSMATCCPQASGEEVPQQSSIDDPGCCERVVVVNAKPAAVGVATARQVVTQLPALALPPVELPKIAAVQGIVPIFDPPDLSRPPLRLLHRSLLI